LSATASGITLDSTRAFCPDCGVTEHALITAREGGVFLERICPQQGTVGVPIARDYRWYLERTAAPQPMESMPNAGKLTRGCPFDCGPCECHTARLHLPVVSVTNLCNLDCPICFTHNRPDRAYCKSGDEMERILGHLTAAMGELELINITGGEPTLHPRIFELLELCAHHPIGRVTMNSNGLRLAAEPEFARRLKESGVQVVLSLDTLDPEKSVVIHGRNITREKLAALERLEELDIPTTILIVCIKGVNGEETGRLVRRFLPKPFVRGVTIQNMTFTGRNGSRFQPREHVTMDEVEDLLVSHGGFGKEDFFPLGAYHPLCYSVAYYLAEGERLLPLARLVERRLLTAATARSYVLDGGEELAAAFREGIDRLWAEGEDEGTIALLRRFIRELYPAGGLSRAERQRKAESMIRMVYIHPHMDGDNFDIARVSRCGDLVPDEEGRMIPACSYNLLYRQQDPRFWVEDTP
jgi:uncharacterized radical SAM superfamily Fe-S cluster-containing enzyme